MGRVEGKVALITGAARGQGRAHALRLAEEGADIIAIDACEPIETVGYEAATDADLAETAKLVEEHDRRVVTYKTDVRDLAKLQSDVAAGFADLGRLDVVVANAGIGAIGGPTWDIEETTWQTTIDVNLTGVWKTVKATVPHLIEQNTGGSIIVISSAAGLSGVPNLAHYVTAKHGLVGLMRTLAVELAPLNIRVNSIHPTAVATTMIQNDEALQLFSGGAPGATWDDVIPVFTALNALKIPWVEPVDIANAVLYLASDESRYVTGTTHVIDAGNLLPTKIPHG
jgi:SDR family mycofactocin-dependent oxidoreductase